MRKEKSHITTSKATKKTINTILIRATQFLTLLLVMVSLAGYENTNARIGNSDIDFFADETSQLIRFHVNSLFLDTTITNTYSGIQFQTEQLLSEFYKTRNYNSAWTNNYTTNKSLDTLVSILDSISFYGFPTDYFHSDYLKNLVTDIDTSLSYDKKLKKRVEIDLQATRAAFLLMIYLKNGIVKEDSTRAFNDYLNCLPPILNEGLTNANLENMFAKQHPKLVKYRNLEKAIPDLLTMIQVFRNIPDSLLNEYQLAKGLYYCGILKSPVFDSINTIQTCIEKFQKQKKLEIKGEMDVQTQVKIVTQLQKRYIKVCLNMDRLRKIKTTNSDYLFVNIPEYLLHVIENNNSVDTFNIIVGKSDSPTPLISGKINKIVANPFWTVPRKIARDEMLNKIRTDSTYLQRNGYYIINNKEEEIGIESIVWNDENPLGNNYWIRQKNSRNNALGQVKFLFPNKHSVYLHDTPSRRLFKKEIRAFSHGCVRLENPVELAQYIVDKYANQVDDSIKVKKLVLKRDRKIINLENEVEIIIQYITCDVNEDGTIKFYSDIYKKDAEDIKIIFSLS